MSKYADSETFRRLKPFVAMIFLQFGTSGNALIAKAALNQGMSHYSFIVYRYAVAAILFSPFAYVLERYTCTPRVMY